MKDRSNTKVFLFIDSKKEEIKGFLQFESFIPEIKGTYKFHNITGSTEINDVPLLQSHWCFNLLEAIKEMSKE